jgi:hypothetical protein
MKGQGQCGECCIRYVEHQLQILYVRRVCLRLLPHKVGGGSQVYNTYFAAFKAILPLDIRGAHSLWDGLD